MDTSKEYIKMCEAAEEIQKEWKQRIGDFQLGIGEDEVTITTALSGEALDKPNPNEIWLPRQDQLQEMLDRSQMDACMRIFFANWLMHPDLSMEQLWLAFVMKEKYSKSWNGTEWKGE